MALDMVLPFASAGGRPAGSCFTGAANVATCFYEILSLPQAFEEARPDDECVQAVLAQIPRISYKLS